MNVRQINIKNECFFFVKEHNFKSKNNNKTNIIMNSTTRSQSNYIFSQRVIISVLKRLTNSIKFISFFSNKIILIIVIDLMILLLLLNSEGGRVEGGH